MRRGSITVSRFICGRSADFRITIEDEILGRLVSVDLDASQYAYLISCGSQECDLTFYHGDLSIESHQDERGGVL